MKLVWKIGLGVFIGIVGTALFFGFVSECSKQSAAKESWNENYVATANKDIYFSRSEIMIYKGVMLDAKVSQESGDIRVQVNGKWFDVPADSVTLAEKH